MNVNQSAEDFLNTKSDQWELKLTSEEFAKKMDSEDPLGYIRTKFAYPKMVTIPNGLFRICIFLFD